MKKLLLSAVAVLGLLPGISSTASADLVAENRTNWKISGCSQCGSTNEGEDGVLALIKDGNIKTFWHSEWNNDKAEKHYFVVDRGETLASTKLAAVGYTPRQHSGGNGYVTRCDIYILNSIEGLSCTNADATGSVVGDAGHASLTAFLADKQPTASGSFNYGANDNANRPESIVRFEQEQSGRYILFVATATVGDAAANIHANCAEFKAYTENVAVESIPVTLTYPAVGEFTATLIVNVEVGTSIDATGVIPALDFFSATGVAEEDKVVSDSNNRFTVEGTWSFPFESDKVYRVDIRKKGSTDNGTCSNLLYNSSTNQIDTRIGTDANAFVPERLFYLSSNGFSDAGQLKVTLHSIAVEANKGFQVATPNKSIGSFTETPTEFLVVTNNTGTDGISLQHPDNNICHVNDIDAHLGVWTDARSQNDGGSFLRFFELSEEDFAVYNGVVEPEVYEAAQSSHSAASVRALLEAAPADYVAAVTAANALLATIEGYNYTADHFGDGLGYFSGTSYEAILSMVQSLNEAIVGRNVDAITAATTALQEEVSKVTLNLPQAGKYYRFKGYEGGWYITPTSATGQMAMAETANANSAFLFNAVDGQTNVFTPHNVAFNAGITGTHSLSANGIETYTFYPSKGGYPGVFTIQSNATGADKPGTWLYNHYDNNTSPRVNRNSGYHDRCNWILEEVNADGTTGIEEIAVESEKMQGIYDLQGRRLSAPVKGINIINGKKVLVK